VAIRVTDLRSKQGILISFAAVVSLHCSFLAKAIDISTFCSRCYQNKLHYKVHRIGKSFLKCYSEHWISSKFKQKKLSLKERKYRQEKINTIN
jgi:hypothetical protein